MMTARQFAEKWPGQPLKLSLEGKKEYGLDYGEPIGIVVGFRPGTKGMIGSSKVAIWHDKYPVQYGLDPKTNKSYHEVVSNSPEHRLGIYFISVNHIELVEQPKPITAYPGNCGHCGSPARKGKWFTICSNVHCKVNRVTIKALGPFPVVKIVDAEGFILCPVCQTNNHSLPGHGEKQRANVVCRKGHKFKHTWKDGQKLNYQGSNTFVWKNKELHRVT
jgi:hypothetical protein